METKKIWELKEGERVKFPKTHKRKISYSDGDKFIDDVFIDRYPSFFLDNVANHVGTVSSVDKRDNYNELIVCIKLDKHYEDLDEWDNQLEFYGSIGNDDNLIEDYDMEVINND
jgi:hypothetical protein